MRGSVFAGISLDGFIARADGRLDFLPSDDSESHGFEEFLASVDALIMGRNTYDFVVDSGVWFYGDKPVFVLSTRDIGVPLVGAIVERVSGNPTEIARALDARGIRDAYVDGGATVQQFLRAGLIHRLIVTRVPVLIGSGIPLFADLGRDVALTHVDTRQFHSGLVQSEYAVAG